MFVTVLPVAAASVLMRRAWSLESIIDEDRPTSIGMIPHYLFVIVFPVIVIPFTVTPELIDP